ncbi:hypothetical protein Metho_0680 [Methanomethylovorans hollandica DSM 15978]|uniref:Uncharacterized protein n=1 Tax=Methanomethylovorans hollandica (strain DSM 15978 / NBRC 107637 / DMS1) TaxID=867904 RepID=L0KUY2_METHD|nr:hypothetical protein Metho_0680 [Methanomethylovorans hollandica DSM 15978]
MPIDVNLSLVRIRRSTHRALMHEARALGLKQWAMFELMAEHYFKHRGDPEK